MQTSETQVAELVRKILEEMQVAPPSTRIDGVFASIDEAVEAAVAAQKALLALSLEKRGEIIEMIRARVLEANERLSRLAVSETHLGRVEDKIRENILCCKKTPGIEDIRPIALSGDNGMMLLEYAPVGVIGALTPITNPTGTFINNTIGMVAAGNAVVFNCHPSAKETSRQMLLLLHKAIVDAGGPPGLVGMVAEPTLESANALVSHPKINMLVATGGKGVVDVVLRSGKKAIGAGAGNPPCLVDETANLRRAAKCIVNGASVNNNIFCICEKEVIVVQEVADVLAKFMEETGKAYLLSPEEVRKVTDLVVVDGHINGKYIGRDVQVILKDAGIVVGDEYRLAFFHAEKDHPLVWIEQMMPILPMVTVKNVQEGIRFGVEVEKGNRHTAIMHSTNVDNLTAFARAVQTTIFVKNAPCYAGIGLGGEGHTSFTIAGPTGEGLTSARTFTRQRRCVLAEAFRII
ncbi:putative aldehyde dehydrogenase, ethanolamine utilization protein [uncultured Alphaproteobacteria bacterium]|uniref:Putative aldehyde dehydrogenase, ethanolamine utilization protein n=1 Tax=uncultured Alphaproteobacteria bacterium TaxID=91750 RepID=A0A212IV59_9PROT|nr:putative aldehyde dehydrogenase, ethanolamine utilization protein [uncultured Alphaproteobacteria bacterium]